MKGQPCRYLRDVSGRGKSKVKVLELQTPDMLEEYSGLQGSRSGVSEGQKGAGGVRMGVEWGESDHERPGGHCVSCFLSPIILS